MKTFSLSLFALCAIVLTGCSSPELTPEQKAKRMFDRVRIVQTQTFVTFRNFSHPDGDAIKSVQEFAENWQKENPQFTVKGFSTSQNGHGSFQFCLTLQIERNQLAEKN